MQKSLFPDRIVLSATAPIHLHQTSTKPVGDDVFFVDFSLSKKVQLVFSIVDFASMKVFDILYTKDPSHKKRKVYHDGLMKIEENCRGSTSFKVILLNEDSKVLIQVGEQDVSKYSCDTEVKVGNFLVQIEKENILSSSSQPLSIQVLNKSVDNAITRNIAEIRPTLLPISKQRIPFKPQSLLSKHSSTSVPSNNKKPEMNSTPSSVVIRP